jgi:hypothetical protein
MIYMFQNDFLVESNKQGRRKWVRAPVKQFFSGPRSNGGLAKNKNICNIFAPWAPFQTYKPW